MIRRAGCLLVLALLPAMAAAAEPVWMVYQRGPAVELALDRASFRWHGRLLQVAHRETFRKQQYEPALKVNYFARKNTVMLDCDNDRYAMIATDYLDQNGKVAWATMFPLPDHMWQFVKVEDGSMAAAMLDIACQTVRHPAYQN
ncbi:hypothetical protein LH435_04480 [Laribacter hongkongensis]|uniref:Surface-adhesin protein E-like domain-containing protein n=1 Tax=Laribacter hongkongensis (strain HLHK9) TaxID=557598 RepID=C1D4E6_LARHH|nr:surface-adhesin E family protein [Laribacter hongkongensis]ACO73740.1 hypothetical protein LHK_00747 [Laribacter hongkongensis HLHK9]MCG8995438.1 hypothetical protein [Laribacter hongkongensis]MCG9011711.1 hypothetical protein [Laribacter hongkongensis]MCG9022313.1 hypothetical protein [Laribacter hongkongensis]MCG9047437.1 hypothetical protein [Laribacter hongkongensis]